MIPDFRKSVLIPIAVAVFGCSSSSPPVHSPSPSDSPSPSPTARSPAATAAFPAKALESLIRKRSRGDFRLALVVRRGRQQVTSHPDESFEAASLVKLPILLEYFAQVEQGLNPSEEMTFEERFRVGGSGEIKKAPAGTRYTLATLAEWMMTKSDNIATDMLLERLTMKQVQARCRILGLKQTTVERTIFDFAAIDRGLDNRTSARDIARILELIADEKCPGAKEIKKILAAQERNDLVTARLPKTVQTAHKTGQLTGFLHDAGILTVEGEAPVLFAVLTRGGNPTVVASELAGLGADLATALNWRSVPKGRE